MFNAVLVVPRVVLVAVGCLPLAGCLGDFLGIACTSELRPNLSVEVRDAGTGSPSAWGATGHAIHEDGRVTELSSIDSLYLFGNWAEEQDGDYLVSVRKPGYKSVQTRTSVADDACHVKTRRVRLSIAVDSVASFQSPHFLRLGEHVQGTSASAGIATYADTLVITGRATAPCSQLLVQAARSGRDLHVQLQPALEADPACDRNKRQQQFVAAYLLPRGNTGIYLTNAYGDPTVLFSGSVWVN